MRWFNLSHLCLILAFPIFMGCSKIERLPKLGPDAVILAFGDSLTAGTGAGVNESYPAVLARISGHKVVNAGIPGEISADGLSRLPEVLDREKPALLILCHCANDLLRHMDQGQAADNLRAMVRMARERGISVVLIAVPLPEITLTPPLFYSGVAKEFGIPCECKILSRILGQRSLKSDYIHPNATGYRKMAEAVADLLKKSGGLP